MFFRFTLGTIAVCTVLTVAVSFADTESTPSKPTLLVAVLPNCPACEQVKPLISQLAAEGFAVQTADASQFPELVRDQLKVNVFPTFLMYSNEQIIDRVVGGGDPINLKPRLLYMFEKAEQIKNDASRTIANNSKLPSDSCRLAANETQFLSSSVKLRVDAENSHSWGTGTIIDTRKSIDTQRDEALILTCGHIFRDSLGKGKIEVQLCDGNSVQRVFGLCLFYDLEIDLALITIFPPGPVKAVPVAPERYCFTAKQRVVSVGCDGGANPTVWQHQILSIDRIGTPANNKVPFHYIQVSGAPVSGRSGGGLFSSDGYLIGVCNTADPKEDDGQFVPPSMIRYVLKSLKLNEVYEKPSLGNSTDKTMLAAQPSPAAVNPSIRRESSNMQLQAIKVAELPPRSATCPQPSAIPATVQPSKMSPTESATLEEIQRRMKDGDEVILITRSRRNPENPTDVIVLNGTSDQFLQALTQPKQAAEKYNPEYNPAILSSHEGQPAAAQLRLTNNPQSSGQRPVTFPVLH